MSDFHKLLQDRLRLQDPFKPSFPIREATRIPSKTKATISAIEPKGLCSNMESLNSPNEAARAGNQNKRAHVEA